MKKILITGSSGFLGSRLALAMINYDNRTIQKTTITILHLPDNE